MRIIHLVSSFIAMIMLSTVSYASDENRLFQLTMINHSNNTFELKALAHPSGVSLKSSETRWLPGTTMQITAENISSNGVAGKIYFVDDQERIVYVRLEVREQRHYGQPIYGMHTANYGTTVLSSTRNHNIGGRFLTHTAATIELKNVDAK